ncbi:MAG: M13 family metallopeptidase [Candidatus Acidiferrales bacterium]
MIQLIHRCIRISRRGELLSAVPALCVLSAALLFAPAALRAQSAGAQRKASPSGSSRIETFRGNCSELFGDSDAGGGAEARQSSASKSKTESASAARGFNLANLDRSVSPCQNFWKFADGGWIKSHPIPADHSAWGTFNIIDEHNKEILHQILEEASKDTHARPGSNWQKIGEYYGSCMNTSAIEAAGIKPLDPEFQRIAAISNDKELEAEIARLHGMGVNVGFQFGSEQDLKNSSEVIAGAGQGGLGLLDRQYYLDQDARSKALRTEYTAHVAKMLALLGDNPSKASSEAATVMKIETMLAEGSTKVADLRIPEKNYHPMTLRQLDDVTPHFSWQSYFQEVGRPHLKGEDMGQPAFFKALDSAIATVPMADWKVYLRWHLLHTAAPALPEKFEQEYFNFYGRTLTGQKVMQPRWQRCVRSTDRELGEALGQYYVKRAFPPEAKARALAMVKDIMAALHQDLTTLSWMSPATRKQAIAKLDMITVKIGYPDKWRDYSNYKVTSGPYVENLLHGNDFEFHWDLSKIGKPVDRTLWDMTPPTVNAYYNPSMNEIVFPAGILQPPFFSPKADDASNYGGIGAVIGHEMTHGFDDEGAKFDGHGNLKNWWTPQDLKNFDARGECIVKQFDGYQAYGLHEPGKLDEGESIADLGGMTIAYRAFQTTPEAKAGKPIDGFTPDQRFFLAYARNWASNLRPQIARKYMRTDPHPMDQFRANGPLSNTPAFAKAFGCSANSPMVRPAGQRCQIW